MQFVLIGDLFRKASVTYQVRLNRFQTQTDLVLEQASLVEEYELDFTGYFPPDETERMVSTVENQLKRVEEILQSIDQVDFKATLVQQPTFDSWGLLDQGGMHRNIARAFSFRSEWSRVQGDFDGALNDAMQIVKLPSVFVDHRTIVTRLVALAVEGIGAYSAAPTINEASDVALSQALTELLKIEETEVDAVVDYQNDWALDWYSLNWLGRLVTLCGEAQHRESLAGAENAVKRCQATRRQLIVMMALELYKRNHGELPAQLEALVPKFISAVPLDPFDDSGGAFTYRREGEGYLLYSLGFDGKDDGGCNHEFGYGSWSDDADLNFPEAVVQSLIEEQNEREETLKELENAETK